MNTKPEYKTFPAYHYVLLKEVCDVPVHVIEFFNKFLDKLHDDKPEGDLSSPGYRQWNLQTKPIHLKRQAYFQEWIYPEVSKHLAWMLDYVDCVGGCRMSMLQPRQKVPFHSGHTSPRIHIMLNKADARFYVHDPHTNVNKSMVMRHGKAYFANVIYPHKVESMDSNTRRNLFFSFEKFATPELEKIFLRNMVA